MKRPEPRWPALVSALTVGVLHYALPAEIRPYPEWVPLAFIAVFLSLALLFYQANRMRLNEGFGYATSFALVVFTGWSVARLVNAVALHEPVTAPQVLRSAALLWLSNVCIFAALYWHLDAGGPNARDVRRKRGEAHPTDSAFAFPESERREDGWHPQFMDYFFLAFNTSTALSPADVSPLDRSAKAAMAVQASISLVIVVILAARAVNVL